jgi:hypothetical protein
MKVLYSIGDSITWGAELNDKRNRFSRIIADELGYIDFNCASSGISNDRIFRNTIRDISKFLNGNKISNEEIGSIKAKDIFVLVQFTTPTRFDYFDGDVFLPERFWDNDKWGYKDIHRVTDNPYIINQTDARASYVRMFQQVLTLDSFLEKNNIPHLIVNGFVDFDENDCILFDARTCEEKILKIFDTTDDYFGLRNMYHLLPTSFKEPSLYRNLDNNCFAERGHANKKGNLIIGDVLIKKIYDILKPKRKAQK